MANILSQLKLRHKIVNILTLPILNKAWRKRIAHWLERCSLLSPICFMCFALKKVKNNTVLLFEANDCHAEVMMGYAKYLLDLGYNVDVLMSVVNWKEKPFARVKDQRIRIFPFGRMFLHWLLQLNKIKKYEFIFITSSRYLVDYDYSKVISVGQYLGFWPQGKRKTLIVEHDLPDIEDFNLQECERNKQIITLAEFSRGIMVNPHYFGKYKTHDHKNDITKFIVVGGVNQAKKNYHLLIDVLRKLQNQNINCQITVIGDGKLKNMPANMHKYFKFLGRLDFPDMFAEMEQADFFLPLLDKNNQEHLRYITTGVTGSVQLIYGFAKPCLIQDKFAEFYGFDENNAIVYDNDLSEAILQAMAIDNSSYKKICNGVELLAQNVYRQSLHNLKEVI